MFCLVKILLFFIIYSMDFRTCLSISHNKILQEFLIGMALYPLLVDLDKIDILQYWLHTHEHCVSLNLLFSFLLFQQSFLVFSVEALPIFFSNWSICIFFFINSTLLFPLCLNSLYCHNFIIFYTKVYAIKCKNLSVQIGELWCAYTLMYSLPWSKSLSH